MRGIARTTGALVVALLLLAPAPAEEARPSSTFDVALETARRALEQDDLVEARRQVVRALERDAKSPRAWALRAQWAEAAGDRDEHVYALHKQLALRIAQGAPAKETRPLRKRLEAVDPIAKRYLDLSHTYVDKLMDLAKAYRKAHRPHSAIRVYQQVLALDPERLDAKQAIEEISAAPDPSLAETAKPQDLLADVSDEWIRAFDAQHKTWEERAELERENYTTYTDAGYEVLVRSAEAMEQMNAFYRVFFQYGVDGGSVPRIALNIFRERDTYLKLGIGPPVDWSKGHFTGGAVETWIGDSGFDDMTRTLFHEAAHQFVSLATNAVGWLNEGLASFFEGCRIQSNGTVIMNMPANHRLFPLASRMEAGWMASATDGMNAANPSASRPTKAPTFRIVIENQYAWGPPWYAPTWGLVYFLYNYQDPVDGRFVYRDAFRTYIDTSGGRTGEGAIENFEEVVLGNPERMTKSLAKEGGTTVALPTTVDDVDAVWKAWILALRDEQRGSREVERPFLDWARYAIERKDYEDAVEHFEKGIRETPRDVELLEAFSEHLAGRMRNKDRATKLLNQAIAVLESAEEVDSERVAALERQLEKLDAKHASLSRVHRNLERSASAIAENYLAEELYLMAMHVSIGLGTHLRMPGMLAFFRDAVRRSGKTLSLWQLAYNENDLDGWATGGGTVFEPYGTILRSAFGTYKPNQYDYSFLTMDKVTSGDFSVEADVRAIRGENAFAGLVFGRKSGQAFHALVYFPEGFVDLASFYGPGVYKTWRHEAVPDGTSDWRRLRVDITGRHADVWLDGEPIASQTFPNKGVLQGSFGLLTGPGKVQYRNVRYLARDANDPGGLLEREIRIEAAAREGKRRPGSFMEQVPPWPQVAAWVQGERSSWDEKGLVPTLVVLWSMGQNKVMPLEAWLAALAEQHADTGLEIVSVCENAYPATVQEYLKAHPFPGSVAVDALDRAAGGIGETMDAFEMKRHGFPHVLLLDIDQKVVWEGNPGFSMNRPWKPGEQTYVDAPLAELVQRRNLKRLRPWLAAWDETGLPAVLAGDLEAALPWLHEAETLPADLVPRVAKAQAVLHDIEGALASYDATLDTIVKREAEPALAVLAVWAELLERPLEGKDRSATTRALKGTRASAWKTLARLASQAEKKLADGKDLTETLAPLVERLGKLQGALPAALRAELEPAYEAGDADRVARLLADVPARPTRWLVTEYFRFQ